MGVEQGGKTVTNTSGSVEIINLSQLKNLA
jgi:hypothetical protein